MFSSIAMTDEGASGAAVNVGTEQELIDALGNKESEIVLTSDVMITTDVIVESDVLIKRNDEYFLNISNEGSLTINGQMKTENRASIKNEGTITISKDGHLKTYSLLFSGTACKLVVEGGTLETSRIIPYGSYAALAFDINKGGVVTAPESFNLGKGIMNINDGGTLVVGTRTDGVIMATVVNVNMGGAIEISIGSGLLIPAFINVYGTIEAYGKLNAAHINIKDQGKIITDGGSQAYFESLMNYGTNSSNDGLEGVPNSIFAEYYEGPDDVTELAWFKITINTNGGIIIDPSYEEEIEGQVYSTYCFPGKSITMPEVTGSEYALKGWDQEFIATPTSDMEYTVEWDMPEDRSSDTGILLVMGIVAIIILAAIAVAVKNR